MLRLYRLAQAICVAAALAVPAAADVTLSKSNDPRIDLGIRGLFDSERNLLSSVSRTRAAALVTPPRRGKDVTAARRFDPNYLASLPTARGDKHFACLAEALYFEARGETLEGQFGVAEVILNRVDSARYPDTVCAVVNQGTGKRYACQFTYTCDGRAENITEPAAYDRVAKVARIALDGAPRDLTDGALYYHTKAVRPRWSRTFHRTTTIGVHHFYRPTTQLSQY